MAANSGSDGSPEKFLAEGLKRFCRSLELCDDYLRGYYGLKTVSPHDPLSYDQPNSQQVTDKLLAEPVKSKKQETDGFTLPDQKTIEKLNETATKKLGEIVRRYAAQEELWQGYDVNEIRAARALLAKSSPEVVR